MKIIGIYKITNTVTNDFYIGSSKDVKRRWREHKCPSRWNKCPNNQMYLDMQKYGIDNFVFEILEVVEEDSLKEREQQFIKKLKPTYNDRNAKGWDTERYKECNRKANRKYEKSDKRKKYKKEYNKEYRKTDKCKAYQKTDKYKESRRKAVNKYYNQLCCFNGETLTLNALRKRFKRQGIDHSTVEAKKYLI